MTKYFIKKQTLEEITDIVKTKTGITNEIEVGKMQEEVENLEIQDKTNEILNKTIVSYSNNQASMVYKSVFRDCKSLVSIDMPACTTIKQLAFYSCSNLTSANFPVCSNIEASAFQWCTKLSSISFPACINISSCAFYICSKLQTLTLAGSQVCTLSNSNAFTSAPIANIYVPSSLVTSYQAATNWTYFSNKIKAI